VARSDLLNRGHDRRFPGAVVFYCHWAEHELRRRLTRADWT